MTSRFLIIFTALFTFATGTLSSAAHTVTRDQRFVYLKTPYYQMMHEERTLLIQMAIEGLIQSLEASVPRKPPAGMLLLDHLKQTSDKADELIKTIEGIITGKDLRTPMQFKEIPGFRFTDSAPSAFLVYAGGRWKKGSTGKLGFGYSPTGGWIIQPVRVSRIDLLTRAVTTYYEFHTALVGWLIGGEGGFSTDLSQAPNFRVGFGFIWGPLERPEDFIGFEAGLTLTTMIKLRSKEVGLNVRGGVLFNRVSGRTQVQNYLLSAGLEFGPNTGTDIHGFATHVTDLDAILQFMNVGDDVLNGKRFEITENQEYNAAAVTLPANIPYQQEKSQQPITPPPGGIKIPDSLKYGIPKLDTATPVGHPQ